MSLDLHSVWGALGALSPLPEEEGGSTLVRMIILAAVFIGPAILKSIKESQRKKRELTERAGSAPLDNEVASSTASGDEDQPQEKLSGREQWERLLRGESVAVPAPPPIPRAPAEAGRRILTEAPALDAAPALTDEPAWSDARLPETATPGQPYDDSPSYDEPGAQPSRLGRDFAKFAPQQGMASDRAGGPLKRVGGAASFSGSAEFLSLGTDSAASVVTRAEIGAASADKAPSQKRRAGKSRFDRDQLRRFVLGAEVLGPPVAMRPLDSGPTRPVGWS